MTYITLEFEGDVKFFYHSNNIVGDCYYPLKYPFVNNDEFSQFSQGTYSGKGPM